MANYVGLNVGGLIYRTSRTTLGSASGSFFSTLISGDIPSERDEQGNYLIDRDGEVFRHILNFLRNGTLLLPHGFKDFSLLEREADFFMLESLKKEIPVGINCSGAIFQIPRSDFDRVREPTSCLRDILSGEKVTPLDADGNVLLDIPQDHFRYLREYLKPGNNVFSTTRSMLGNSNICPSLSKAADIFGLDILQAHVSSVQRMEGKIYSDSGPPTPVLLDLYYDSSDGVYTVYCTFLGIFVSSALSRLTLRDLGGVHGATFSLNNDRAGTDVQHLIENDVGHHIPSNWEEMIALMAKITGSRPSHTDVFAGCKKAEFEEDEHYGFDY